MKKLFTTFILFILAASSVHAAQPDILFVLVDDLRWDSLGFTGHPYVKTPQLDTLRESGALMENAFCTTSICCPSRATFLTGTYASRHGVIDNETSEYNPDITPPLTKYLQEAGYKTAMIGKWHMGHSAEPRPYFDHWISFPGQGKYNDVEVNINGKKVKWKGYTTDLLTDEAIRFIEDQPKDKPYFCMLSHKAVHEPFVPAPRHKDAFGANQVDIEPESWSDEFLNKPEWQRRQRVSDVRWNWRTSDILAEELPDAVDAQPWKTGQKKYIQQFRCLAAVDDGIGRLLQTLEKRGTLDNTLIIFTSDNGYFHGEHRRWDKRLAYEESQRIPMIIAYRGKIKPGSAVSELVANVDFAPTVLDYAGIKIPEQMQGKSMRPLLEQKPTEWRSSVFYEYWVDLVHAIPSMTAVRTDQYKLITYPELNEMDELYDIQNDPHELNNLAANPESAPLQQEMKTLLAEQKQQVGWSPEVFPKNLPRFRGPEGETIQVIRKPIELAGKGGGEEFSETIDPSSWPFRIDIELKAESDGVVATQAGKKYGYKIYIENGRPGITVLCKTWIDSRTTIDAPDSIIGKWSTIQALIDYNRVKFVVDGKLIESRALPQPFKGETGSPLIIGAGGPNKVYDDVPHNPLKGTVRSVILQRDFLETDDLPKAKLTARTTATDTRSRIQEARPTNELVDTANVAKTIQFGGDAQLIEKRGVDEIIQWNGVTNLKKAFGGAGTLINKGPGATLTSGEITLTSRAILGAPCTTAAETSLGVAPKGKWGNFKTAEGDAWTFSFDKPVELTELLFVGMNDQNDIIEITVDGKTETVTRDDMDGTQKWSKKWDLKSTTRSINVPANAEITIKAAGTDAQFGLYAVTVKTHAQNPDQPKKKASPVKAGPAYNASVPEPTLTEVRYGEHERNVLDFWKAESDKPTPLVFVIHGGGWKEGTKEKLHTFVDTQALLKAGISVVAINYRLIWHAGGVEPPVKVPLDDAARALQFVRSKATEWNIDKTRIGATGGSAGACSSLWLATHDDLADPASNDPVARESTRLWCVAATRAQTTLDPKQMVEWTPNSRYGGHAFGKKDFAQFLAERESILPWIAEYSPYSLVSSDDPPIALFYTTAPAMGEDQKDPTHTANFGVKFQEHCLEIGVECELVYPGAADVLHQTPTDYLIWMLNECSGNRQR